MVSAAEADGAFAPLMDFSGELLGVGNSGGSAAVRLADEEEAESAGAAGFASGLMG
jgi:hypothetical protein